MKKLTISSKVYKLTNLISLALVIVGLSACQKNEEAAPLVEAQKVRAPEVVIPVESWNLAAETKRFNTKCMVAGDQCPAQLGQVYFMSEGSSGNGPSVGVCTSFLVAKNLVLTNSHCIPDQLKEDKNLDCSEHMRVRFPKVAGYEQEELACKKIHFYSEMSDDIYEIKTDIALIELENEVERPTYEVDTTGVIEGRQLTAWSFNPVKLGNRAYEGQLVRRSCVPVFNSISNPLAQSATSPLVELEGCEVIPGNSGSPVIDDTGKARAIINVKWGHERLIYRFINLIHEDEAVVPEHSQAINLACLDVQDVDSAQVQIKADCLGLYSEADHINALDQQARRGLNEAEKTKVMNLSSRWENQLKSELPNLEWKTTFLNGAIFDNTQQIFLQVEPRCAHANAEGMVEVPSEIVFSQAPFCRVDVRLDRHLRVRETLLKSCSVGRGNLQADFRVVGTPDEGYLVMALRYNPERGHGRELWPITYTGPLVACE